MTTDYHALITKMADELDRCQQLLLDDRRQRHPLAAHARAVLAEADGPAVPEGREPASVATQPSEPEAEVPTDMALWTMYDEMCGEPGEWAWVRDYARAVLDRWGHQSAQPVPASERLPGLEDCDAEDSCWWFDPHADGAWYMDTYMSCYTHWLPAHALPTPEATDD